MDELPHTLKKEVSLYIYRNRYDKVNYFYDKSTSFIAWVCAMLKPKFYEES